MAQLCEPDRIMLGILMTCMFCVSIVTMQSYIVRHTEPSGIFTSGQYPDTGATDGAWELTIDQNHQILLQFLDFSLNETTSCTVDVLELYNGGQSDKVLIDHFCWADGTALASTAYVSTGNQLYLRLFTAEGYSRKGFRAHYTSVDLQHTNSSGDITSPGYPNTGHPLDEAWRIRVGKGYQIRLGILDFALHSSISCDTDYFEIYDGASNRYCIMERWCWESFSQLPQTVFISSGNTLYLRLRTIHGHFRKGFNASYVSVPRHTTVSGGLDVMGNERFSSGASKATSPGTLKVFTQAILNNGISVTTTSNLNNKSTSSTISPTKNGIVVGILVVVVFTVFVIAIIVWKFKIRKAKSSPPKGHAVQPQIAHNPGTYEDVNLRKDAINRGSLETSHQRKSVVNLSANVTTAYVEPCCVYSKEIIQQTSERKVDTPDGTYETPDVNLYSYANPNELF